MNVKITYILMKYAYNFDTLIGYLLVNRHKITHLYPFSAYITGSLNRYIGLKTKMNPFYYHATRTKTNN